LIAGLILVLLWLRFPRYGSLLAPAAAGFVTALLLLLLTRPSEPVGVREWAGGNWSVHPPLNVLLPALLAPALVVLLLAAAYRLYSGYGLALAALGAVALLPWLAERSPASLSRALFGLLATAILFRVYYHTYDLVDTDIPLTAHYTLIGLLAGALTPFVFGAIQATNDLPPATASSPSVRDGLLPAVYCLLSAALPLLLALFWGEKVGGGLLLGLVIGHGYRIMTALLEADTPGRLGAVGARVPEAALLVLAWVTVQILDWGSSFGQQLLRAQRVGIVVALIAVSLVAILVRAARRPDVRH
jgi:hypothetical protein